MNNEPCIIDAATGEIETLHPTRGKRYRVKLDTSEHVRQEMSKIYREARSGLLNTADMNKFIWALREIGNQIKTTELESRVEALEMSSSNEQH